MHFYLTITPQGFRFGTLHIPCSQQPFFLFDCPRVASNRSLHSTVHRLFHLFSTSIIPIAKTIKEHVTNIEGSDHLFLRVLWLNTDSKNNTNFMGIFATKPEPCLYELKLL